MNPIVNITSSALRAIKHQSKKKGLESFFLRLGVKGGGCSGLSYVIDFETTPDPEFDITYSVEDLNVVIDIKSSKFLNGATLDYDIKNLMEGGFVFINPNATRSCGCGTSFTAK